MYECKHCGASVGTTHKDGCPQLRGLSVSRAGDGSAGDRVSIDRDALRVLCLAAGNLCRKRTDKRVAAVRAALNRLDADWEQYRQNAEHDTRH